MVNLTDKEDRPYKTRPRYHERRVTDHGLCIWQLNKMLRGSGYKITRITGGTSELILIPTGYKKVELVDPFTGLGYVRLYPRYKTLEKWEKVINNLMTRPVTKEWIISQFVKAVQPSYRTWNNKPDWPAIHKRADQLWKEHFPKM